MANVTFTGFVQESVLFSTLNLGDAFKIDAAPGVLYRKVGGGEALNENTKGIEGANGNLACFPIAESAIEISVAA